MEIDDTPLEIWIRETFKAYNRLGITDNVIMGIQVKALPLQNMTLEQYTNTQINSIEGQILESNATTLGNLPAHQIVFTNIGLKTMQVWTLKDDKVCCRRRRLRERYTDCTEND